MSVRARASKTYRSRHAAQRVTERAPNSVSETA